MGKIFIAVLMLVLRACFPKNNSSIQENDKTSQNLRLAKEWMDAFVRSDLDRMNAIMTPGAQVFGLGDNELMTFPQFVDKLKWRKERATFSIRVLC